MKLNRVLVVIKPHTPDAFQFAAARGRKVARDPVSAYVEALNQVESVLSRLGLHYIIAQRELLLADHCSDLVLSLGGDGTFLAAAHTAGSAPVLGLNPLPEHSVGFFCKAGLKNLERLLSDIKSGKVKPTPAPLVEISLNGKALPACALNDVLFAGASPAETVRYKIKIGKTLEEQRSSGLWISAGPGSTAAIRSAGGKKLPMFSKQLQYVVRELCPFPGQSYKLRSGMLAQGAKISLTSHMKDAMIYIDGHWRSYPVPPGAEVLCRVSRHTLSIFV